MRIIKIIKERIAANERIKSDLKDFRERIKPINNKNDLLCQIRKEKK